MKSKFTIIFYDIRHDKVCQGHSEGRTWAEAGHTLLENIAKKDRKDRGSTTTVGDFDVLFAYPGHITSLI